MLFEERDRAESFGAQARRYDRARPTYPPALIDAVLRGATPAVLDVGCGTGISARLFADRGCTVLGVETDPRMAEVATAHGVAVEVAPFEEWDPVGRTFGVVASGQAWHWVDPDRGAHRARAVLEPGGRVALFWNVASLPEALRPAIDEVYLRIAPEIDQHSVLLGRVDPDRFDLPAVGLRASGGFTEPSRHAFSWTRSYTTAEWLDQLPTHSDHASLPPAQQAELLDAVGTVIDAAGGAFSMDYEAVLITATAR